MATGSAVAVLLVLLPWSLAHRDGARSSESCYDHDVVHTQPGTPPSFKQVCILACSYILTLVGEYDVENMELINSNVAELRCGSTYQCELQLHLQSE